MHTFCQLPYKQGVQVKNAKSTQILPEIRPPDFGSPFLQQEIYKTIHSKHSRSHMSASLSFGLFGISSAGAAQSFGRHVSDCGAKRAHSGFVPPTPGVVCRNADAHKHVIQTQRIKSIPTAFLFFTADFRL